MSMDKLFFDIEKKFLKIQSEITELKSEVKILKKENNFLKKSMVLKKEYEIEYQNYLEGKYNATHKVNEYGRVDLETEDSIIEVKRWSLFKHAIGQVVTYCHNTGKKRVIYFFGALPKKLDSIKKVLSAQNIESYHIYKSGDKFVETEITTYVSEIDEEDNFEINHLYDFLVKKTVYEKNSVILMEDIRKIYGEDIGEEVEKLDNPTFLQVDNRYQIKPMMICKKCNKRAKKDCCPDYKNSERTRKISVKNIKWRSAECESN